MTSHYIEIMVVPGPEVGAPHLLGALYDRLHLTLVQHRVDDIGVSFPGYSLQPRTLGTRLRLHGSEDTLRSLFRIDWLKGVRDHVRVEGIAPTPLDARHRTVHRRQFKTSAERLRRRRMRRKGETAEQAVAAIPLHVERRPDLPYVQARSRSTGQPYSLFIALGALQPIPSQGPYNSHGLSTTSTVPWF